MIRTSRTFLAITISFIFLLSSCTEKEPEISSSDEPEITIDAPKPQEGVPWEDLLNEDIQTPLIVETQYPTQDRVVADLVATNSRYGADPTGINDSTSAIQQAIDECYYIGGGTVFLPAGRYRITGKIRVRPFVTLRGDRQDPDKGTNYGTVILADIKSEDVINDGTFVLGGSSGVMEITVYYPDQSLDDIKPYPFTFYVPGNSVGNDHYMLQSIIGCTVINGYRGIGACVDTGVHEMLTVRDFKGTFLKDGVIVYNQADVGSWDDVVISDRYWAQHESSPEEYRLELYTRENTVGMTLGDLEWTQFSRIKIENTSIGIHIVKGKRIEFAGSLFDVDVTGCRTALKVDHIDERWGMLMAGGRLEGSVLALENNTSGTIKLTDIDILGGIEGNNIHQQEALLPEASEPSFFLPPARMYNVSRDYGADRSGTVDASVSIQYALNEAYRDGGGVVYLSPGEYRLDEPVTVPANVELRGSSTVAVRDQSGLSIGTVILAYYGAGTEKPESDDALITIDGENAGIRGLRIIYPENAPADKDVSQYPYSIRGIAPNVYAVNIALNASYYGIDIQGAPGAVVHGLVSCCYENTIRIENSDGVIIRSSLQNGNVLTRHGMPLEGWLTEDKIFTDLFDPITRKRTIYLKAKDSDDLSIDNCFAYGVKTLLEFEDCDDTVAVNIGADNIGKKTPMLSIKGGSAVIVNMMRYNGKSFEADSADLSIYNRISINESGEDNFTN